MFAVMYLETGCFGKVLVAWFAVVFLLPYMFRPDMILQGLRPRQSFVTNVACAVVFGRGRGGFPKIFPFSMAGADLPAFLGFRDGAFGFARYQSQLLAAPVPDRLFPSAPQELQDH